MNCFWYEYFYVSQQIIFTIQECKSKTGTL